MIALRASVLVLIGLTIGLVGVVSDVARADVAPVNTTLPTLSGAPQVGQTLTVSNGNWDGDTPLTYQYRWRRCDAGGANCVDITGATASTYALVTADVGSTVRVVVTATNTSGSATATSDPTASPIFDTYRGTVVADSPYAYFPLNDATGASTISDASGNGANGTGHAHTASTSTPIINEAAGGSASYNGSTRWDDLWPVNLHTSPFNDRVTLEAWIKPSNTTQNGKVLSKHTGTDDLQVSLGVYAGKTYGEGMIGGSYISVAGVTPYSTSTWTYVALVYDGAKLRLYEQGVEVASTTATGAIQSGSFASVRRYAIGRVAGDHAGNEFSGLIDDVAIYPSALSASRIQQHFKAANPSGWPVATSAPAISGTPTQGWTLTMTNGNWTNNPDTFTYHWQRCNPAGTNCTDIPGATATTYALTPADTGSTIGGSVTGTNPNGATTAYTASRTPTVDPTTQIQPPLPGQGCPTPWQAVNAREVARVQWLCNGHLNIDPTRALGPTDVIQECRPTTGWPYNSCGSDSQTWDGWGWALSFRQEVEDLFGPANAASAPGTLIERPPSDCAEQVPCFWRVAWGDGEPDGQARGDCSGSIHKRSQSECDGDPINGATGGFRDSVTDLELPGIGIPFVLTRYYNSEDSARSGFGGGWSYSYGPELRGCAGSGNVVLHAEDGQLLVYQRQQDGSFAALPGGGSTLAAVTGGFELTRQDGIVYRFGTNCHLSWIRDRNGNQITLNYGASGWLTSITDTVGRTITISHAPNGQISSVTLPDGRHVDYGYTFTQIGVNASDYRLTSVTDTRGGATTYSYDSLGHLATITDQLQHRVIQNTYDDAGRVSAQRDALDHLTTFGWDPATQTLTSTDARNNVWKDVYNHNQLVERIDPLDNHTTYAYGTDGNLTSITNPRGKTTTFTYDSRGNVLTETAPAPLSYEETFTYNTSNDLTSKTDGRGNTTSYSYDTHGNLTGITYPGPASITIGRATNGMPTTITDERGKTTTLNYDTSGNPTTLTTPRGSLATFGYDSSGRLTRIVEPRGNVTGATPDDYATTLTYNAADDVTSRTDPLGHATSWTRDLAGNVTSRTDANSHTTAFTYDAVNRLTTVTAPGNAVTSYTYDPVGNLLTKTDPNTHTTTLAYDAGNRLASVTTANSKQWTYEHDADGNLSKIVDANGNATPVTGDGTTNLGYDAVDRLTSITYSDGTPSVAFGYDANDNRTSITDGGGSETTTYDARNRITHTTRGTDDFSYSYDAAGNVTQRIYPGGREITYSYDDDGNLASATSNAKTTTYGYDVSSNLTETDLPSANGYVETRTYDRAGRLNEVRSAKAGTTLALAQYTFDSVGNPTTVTTANGNATYSYDSRDRLTEVCYQTSCPGANDPFIRYAYDPVGNRTTETRPTGTTTYNYNAADQLTSVVTPSDTVNYAYDADGNQLQAGARTFNWNLAGKLTSTNAGGVTTTYSYDGLGNRTQSASQGASTDYLWDLNNSLPQLALERSSGSIVRSYMRGEEAISVDDGGATHYFHHDGLGSVVNVTGPTGDAEWTYSYEPFGAPHATVHDTPTAPASGLRFAGELLDESTGLYDLRARQYDSTTGTFLAPDPLTRSATSPSISSYIYADARPLVFTDPSGLGPIWGPECHGDGFFKAVWHAIKCTVKEFGTPCLRGGTEGFSAGWWAGEGAGWWALEGCLKAVSQKVADGTGHPWIGRTAEMVGFGRNLQAGVQGLNQRVDDLVDTVYGLPPVIGGTRTSVSYSDGALTVVSRSWAVGVIGGL